jgi:hypothetical protein
MVYRGMTNTTFSHLTDQAVLAEARRVVEHDRHATAQVITLLMELDARRLYLGEGYSSLFAYCTQALRLSEHATYGRIAAAQPARRSSQLTQAAKEGAALQFPVILELLADGSINLTTVTLLASELTPENYREVLASARHRSKREVQELVAALHPQPTVPSVVRKLPAPKPVASRPAAGPQSLLADAGDRPRPAEAPANNVTVPSPPAVVIAPLAPERYKIQFTVTKRLRPEGGASLRVADRERVRVGPRAQ